VAPAHRAFDAVSSAAALVGDSITDIEASRLPGIYSIGLANRAEKHESMVVSGAGSVTHTLANLVTKVQAPKIDW